ncbi:MAG: orotate phosphoribosyltransferase [Planctomycetes bacterium]|nr:orotate phosphoribosyltransferase [Planctomycetota bacterium]MDP6410899.1 orotate phosphoribosyltransferase [Planctomycetota bacterium]
MRDAVLDHFRQTGALLEGHFELSSGLHSDRYLQCALVLSEPRRAEALARAFAERLETDVDVVVGPAMGAVVWAQEIGRALDRRAMFTERSGGEMTLRRGFRFETGERCLVVEDVLTTGGSAKEALEVVRAHGGLPVAVGSIINRSGGNPFEDEELPLTCLAEVEVQVWEPDVCPLCAAGGAAVKPGSRTALAGGGA